MATLDDLFPGGRNLRDTPVVHDDHHTVRRLDAMFGDRRADLEVTHRASGRRALVSLVDQAAGGVAPTTGATAGASEGGSRSRRRIDVLSAAVAGLAVVAVVTTAIVGGVQAATASPADDALQVLTADEKTIESAESALASARTKVEEDIAAGDARAEALRKALPGVSTAPDPVDIPPGETEAPEDAGRIDIIDPAVLATLTAAIETYRKDLAAIELPPLPAEYDPADVDHDDSLDAVAAAIDAAQLRLSEIDGATAAVREVRASVQERNDAFVAQLATFRATFAAAAQTAIDDNPDATQERKDAVTAAATAVADADLRTDAGIAALQAYRDAEFALVGSQVYADRVREEREREEQRERERERQRQQPVPQPTPTEPTEPTPTGPPTDSTGDLGAG